MKKTITISVDLGELKNSFKIFEQNNQNFDEKFIKEKIKQGKFEILKIDDNEEEDINGIYVNNDEQKKLNNNIKQLEKEKITIILNEKKKIEIFISKKETLVSLRKIFTDFKNFNFKKIDDSICSEKEEKILKIEDIIKKNSNEPYIYLTEDDIIKEKSLPKRTKKNYILNGKDIKEVDKNKLLSDLRKELKLDDNDFFMNDSKEINKLNEKDLKFSDIESDNNINIIIIKKKFEFEFITEENIKFKGVFFEDEKLSKVRKICKIKDKYLFTDKNGENINKEEEDSVTLNDLFFNNTIILKSKDKEIKNHSKIDSKIDSKFDSKNDSKIQGNYLKTINNFSIFLYKQEEKFNEKELKNSKTIIMVGETGSGKTTMLNCLTNYLMGVKLSDRFRYFLVDEPERIDNSHSQTSNVNIYYIRSKTNYIPNLRIIDTPGYGDTRGIEYDKKITSMIKEKFEKEIKSINSICFVAKSDKVRFTYEQNYVFNEVFSLFGKDITDNFIFLFTFCDNKEPLIINSLKYNEPFKSFIPKIKQPWYLKFNNSGFFQNPNELFAKTFFQIGEESFRQFLDKLKTLPNKKVNVEQILSVKNENNINIQNLEIEVKNLLKSINNISILIAIMEKNSKKFEEYSNGVFGNNSYSSPNYANYNNKCIIYLPSDIIDYYCNTCRQICLKNHHKNYQFKCQKAGCNHYYQTQHSEKNYREIEQSKIKNTVKSINDIYLSTLNTYATLTILLKDLKLELEKIQIETLEKFEDLDYLKNKNSSKPYDFYESLKKNISDEKKKGNDLGNIFSFSLNTIKEQIDSLKKEFSNKKYASYKNNFEKFQKDALKMKKKEIADKLFVNPSEAILQNCNIF